MNNWNTLLKWSCLLISIAALLIAVYFLSQPKPAVQRTIIVSPNGMKDFKLSMQGRVQYHLTAQRAIEESLSLGVIHSTFLNYLVLNNIIFHASLEKYGDVYFHVKHGEMDVLMHHLRLKYPIVVSSKDKQLNGILRKVDVNLESGFITIKGGAWSYKEKYHRVIEATWKMARFHEP